MSLILLYLPGKDEHPTNKNLHKVCSSGLLSFPGSFLLSTSSLILIKSFDMLKIVNINIFHVKKSYLHLYLT